MNLDELALKVAKELWGEEAVVQEAQEFAHRLVAELTKGQEPYAWVSDGELCFGKPADMYGVAPKPLYAAPVIPAGWVMVPVEPTEEKS